jgi:class 3 adenylate cyclase
MFDFLKFQPRLPGLKYFPMESYSTDLSLEGLVVGVDNIRYDVRLSPDFCDKTSKLAALLIEQETGVWTGDEKERLAELSRRQDSYSQGYDDIMSDAIDKARAAKEIRIDYLAQIAILSMVYEEIRKQYDVLIRHCKSAIRRLGLEGHEDHKTSLRLKENLAHVLQNRERIQQRVGLILCGTFREIRKTKIREMREAVFGQDLLFLLDLLGNPIIHMDNPFNDHFMIEEYDICLGRREEDPDRYERMLNLMRSIYNFLDMEDTTSIHWTLDHRRREIKAEQWSGNKNKAEKALKRLDDWIKQPENIDTLLNRNLTNRHYKLLQKENASQKLLSAQRLRMKHQKLLMGYFYHQFSRTKVMERIAASYEIQPIYRDYCPPLVPQQVLQYLITPKNRRLVKTRLKRLKKLYGKSYRLRPLNRKVVQLERMGSEKKKEHLLRFLRAFCRYHRDFSAFTTYRRASERINLVSDQKTLALSKANQTLYEFLLPHEQEMTEKPICNHTIIKADIRGSTDITHRMNERGLNSATYFSLNFFDPITEILSEYGAHKVFIEGDAIILVIFEQEETPSGWYSVARACGMAVNMLMIINRYNKKGQEHQLPILELGIGICHHSDSPTFLFDGNNRIMISPAINLADRLSGCHKSVRRIIRKNKSPFNLFVFQGATDEEIGKTADDLFLRYNINGIELNDAGFRKLSQEIDLKQFYGDIPDLQLEKVRLFTGKFPTKSGRYQRLVIREARVPAVNPKNLNQRHFTHRKYYEVCTSPTLYKVTEHLL